MSQHIKCDNCGTMQSRTAAAPTPLKPDTVSKYKIFETRLNSSNLKLEETRYDFCSKECLREWANGKEGRRRE